MGPSDAPAAPLWTAVSILLAVHSQCVLPWLPQKHFPSREQDGSGSLETTGFSPGDVGKRCQKPVVSLGSGWPRTPSSPGGGHLLRGLGSQSRIKGSAGVGGRLSLLAEGVGGLPAAAMRGWRPCTCRAPSPNLSARWLRNAHVHQISAGLEGGDEMCRYMSEFVKS